MVPATCPDGDVPDRPDATAVRSDGMISRHDDARRGVYDRYGWAVGRWSGVRDRERGKPLAATLKIVKKKN